MTEGSLRSTSRRPSWKDRRPGRRSRRQASRPLRASRPRPDSLNPFAQERMRPHQVQIGVVGERLRSGDPNDKLRLRLPACWSALSIALTNATLQNSQLLTSHKSSILNGCRPIAATGGLATESRSELASSAIRREAGRIIHTRNRQTTTRRQKPHFRQKKTESATSLARVPDSQLESSGF